MDKVWTKQDVILLGIFVVFLIFLIHNW